MTISTATFDDAFARRDNEFTLLNIDGGPTAENTARPRQARRLSRRPGRDADEFKNGQLSELNRILNILYALLGLSVVVSLLGVVNTLVLSVFERRARSACSARSA